MASVTDAADRDYRLYVLSDCVAGPDPQVHMVLMTSVFPRLADIVDTAELRSFLEGSRNPDGTRPGLGSGRRRII
ncbi:isochorismatase family protein [Spongiactinospora sp. TRM90649]|nr:isochorismatase family protein [Spongiactinospora sp. TRM90649]MDF5757010.1 isochorismatase family protein [Spongiactinospora sp. TRM90649]